MDAKANAGWAPGYANNPNAAAASRIATVSKPGAGPAGAAGREWPSTLATRFARDPPLAAIAASISRMYARNLARISGSCRA